MAERLLLGSVALILSVWGLACSGGDDDVATLSPTATPSATPVPTWLTATASPYSSPTPHATAAPVPTHTPGPTTEDAAFQAFREFAREIEGAAITADGGFFAERGVEIEVTCTGDEQLGPCTGQASGTVIKGIPGVAWASDASGLTPRSEFADLIEQWFGGALSDESDSYAAGAPRLYALASNSQSGEFLAMVTLIRDTGPATGIQRQTRVLRFSPVDQLEDWRFVGEIFAAGDFASAYWLYGPCEGCYDYWELWQGASH